MPIALEDEVTLPDGRSGTVKGIHGDDWYSVTLAAGEEVKIQLEKMSEGGDNEAEAWRKPSRTPTTPPE